MTYTTNAATGSGGGTPEDTPCPDSHIPTLEIRVFGGFDASLDGVPIDTPGARQRRVQALISILALHHGRELFSDYLADSIWPRSTQEKKRNCFYNLWYVSTHAVCAGKRGENPYFERRQGTCRLLDTHVRTDVQEVERACDDLMQRDLDPMRAIDAYRRLQLAYRGDLLPGEVENSIIIRARRDWRERVCGALSTAAQSMMDCNEDRTALWMATVACRLSGMREDVVRLRMELFAKMGMQAYAVRTYNELESFLKDELGVQPSPQSIQLVREMVDASNWVVAKPPRPPRRRGVGKAQVGQQKKADFAFGDALPVQTEILSKPM